MRSATLRLSWPDGSLHPLDDAVAATADVRVDAVHYVNPVGDGAYAELCEFHGDVERARDVLAASPAVERFDVTGDGLAYVHYAASPLMDGLLAVLFEYAVVLEWPVRFTRTQGTPAALVTFVGTERAIGRAVEAIPDPVVVALGRTGAYRPANGRLAASLTTRQRDVLEAAVDAGYYATPREASVRDLAATLDLAPGTVSEHLRRAERTVFEALVD